MKSKKKLVLFATVAVFLALGGWYYYKKSNKRQHTEDAIFYTVEMGSVRADILATGKVQPQSRVEVKAPFPGRIEEIRVNEGSNIMRGQTLALMSSTDRAALLDLASSKGSSDLKEMQEIFRATPIIAPISGQIIARNVEPGQTIAVSDVAFVLSNEPLVVAQVDETDIGRIAVNQPVEITLDAFPSDTIVGHVFQIAYESKTVNNVTIYEVKVAPQKIADHMRSGMTANVRFVLDERKNVVIVPQTLIKQGQEGPEVLLARAAKADDATDGQRERWRSVKLGLTDGKMVEVISGLSAGEVLVDTTPQMINKGKEDKATNPFLPQIRGKGMGRPH